MATVRVNEAVSAEKAQYENTIWQQKNTLKNLEYENRKKVLDLKDQLSKLEAENSKLKKQEEQNKHLQS